MKLYSIKQDGMVVVVDTYYPIIKPWFRVSVTKSKYWIFKEKVWLTSPRPEYTIASTATQPYVSPEHKVLSLLAIELNQ